MRFLNLLEIFGPLPTSLLLLRPESELRREARKSEFLDFSALLNLPTPLTPNLKLALFKGCPSASTFVTGAFVVFIILLSRLVESDFSVFVALVFSDS